jgi:hypothetical protein
MCEPTTIAVAQLAIKGVTAVAQSNAAIEKHNEKNRRYVQNAQNAQDAYFAKTTQENLRVRQEQTKAAQKKRDADLKSMKSQSTASAVAAGSGVQGVDVERLLVDFERSEGMLASRTDQQLAGIMQQSEMNKLGFRSEAISRINSIQPANYAETMFNAITPIAEFGMSALDYKMDQKELEDG